MRATRIRAWLDLVRLPNLFTTVADVLAGHLYVGGLLASPRLFLLMGASACLYAGGVALNDVVDAKRDAKQRPQRPIPSGQVPRNGALLLALVGLGAGAALTLYVSGRAAMLGALLVVAIVLYNCVLKRTLFAPAIMGACRMLNLLLGMSVAPNLATADIVLPAALFWFYIASVTLFARREAEAPALWPLRIAALGACLAAAGLVLLPIVATEVHTNYIIGVALLAAMIARSGLTAIADPREEIVQRSTSVFVMAIIGFDSCLTWSTAGLPPAVLVASLVIPAAILSRRLRIS